MVGNDELLAKVYRDFLMLRSAVRLGDVDVASLYSLKLMSILRAKPPNSKYLKGILSRSELKFPILRAKEHAGYQFWNIAEAASKAFESRG